MSRLVTLSNADGVGGAVRLAVEDGGSVLVSDGELQQIFDLIAERDGMDRDEVLGEYVGFWSDDWGRDPRIPWPTEFVFEGPLNLGEQEGGHADPAIMIGNTGERTLADALKTLGLDESGTSKRVRLRVEVID